MSAVDRAGEEVNRLCVKVDELAIEFGEWAESLRLAAAEPAGWLEAAIGRRIVIHVQDPPDGRSIEGSIAMVGADGVILRAAKLIPETGRPVDLAGEVFIPRAKVLFVQTRPERAT